MICPTVDLSGRGKGYVMKASDCRPDQVAETVRTILTSDKVPEDKIAQALVGIATASSTDEAWIRAMQLFDEYEYTQEEIDEALLGEGITPDFE